MIKITEYKGYTINYDERLREFVFDGAEGAGRYDSQEKAEKRIDVLTKVEFRRIPVMKDTYGKMLMGEITSVNIDDKSAWASFNGKREKLDLKGAWGDTVYLVTPANEAVASALKERQTQVAILEAEIKSIRAKFTDKVTLEYVKNQK